MYTGGPEERPGSDHKGREAEAEGGSDLRAGPRSGLVGEPAQKSGSAL